ncbi:hsp70-binding protein 1-like [Anneissia japonica]|uniref:hsp70-binding protein 1-like n=1 Tax=Anneissia japonica TaxID=1529436 RepID=UPI0014259412|nr:hsp70-binding protein 1-like [Anneissia japonica]XP_033106119.1 hsp70-binding protein 1-like [Anneissia japonica]
MTSRRDRGQQPNNLSGVLQLAVENTVPGDVPNEREEMSEERTEFLRNVFNDLYCDEAKEMKKTVDNIKPLLGSADENDTTVKVACLEQLQELCQTIDNASDFHKIGGTEILKDLLADPNSEVQWNTAELIAMVSQNNPYSQTVLLNHKIMPLLFKLVDRDEASIVKIKALYALSCMVRDHKQCLEEFSELDGFSYLVRAMQGSLTKLRIKASFLLNAILRMDPKHKDVVQKMGVVEQLVRMLQTEHDNTHEYLMLTLLTLVQDHEPAQSDARTPDLNLHKLLKDRQKMLKGKEEFQEELEYSTELFKLLFSTEKVCVDR